MIIEVRRVNERTIMVNNKVVQMDMNNNWIAQHDELSARETREFNEFLNKEKLNFNNRQN